MINFKENEIIHNHNEINKAQEYIFYFEKSIKYFHSFSDDLDGWSN